MTQYERTHQRDALAPSIHHINDDLKILSLCVSLSPKAPTYSLLASLVRHGVKSGMKKKSQKRKKKPKKKEKDRQQSSRVARKAALQRRRPVAKEGQVG